MIYIPHVLFQPVQARIGGVRDQFGRSAGLGGGGLLAGEGVAMDQSMSRGAALDLP